MPAVKRKATKKRKSTRKKKQQSFYGVEFFLERYAKAVGAGLAVVAIAAGLLLWSGGYVGRGVSAAAHSLAASTVRVGLDVRRITARGMEQTSERDLLAAVGPVLGSPLVLLDIHEARARVENLGWVRSAAISRLWPNGVHISVRERVPAAVWQLSGNLHLIDASGAVINQISSGEYSNLPLIVGAGAPEAASEILLALRANPLIWGETLALVRVGGRRWNVRLHKGGDIKFPETGLVGAVRDVARLHEVYGLLDRPIEYVDLRDPNNIVFREVDSDEDVRGDQ